MGDLLLAVEGVVTGDYEPWLRTDAANDLAPKGREWKIPIATTIRVPFIEDDDLQHSMTLKYEFPERIGAGKPRIDRIRTHRETGALYTDTFVSTNLAELNDAIIRRANALISLHDSPLALRGFPWGCKTASEAQSRVAENVRRLLPGAVMDYAITSSGQHLRKIITPVRFVSAWAEGSLVNFETDPFEDTTQYRARSFDFDDKSIEKFVGFLDEQRGFDSREQVRRKDQSLTEHIPGAVRRDAFRRFVLSLVADSRHELRDIPLGPDTSSSLTFLENISDRPSPPEALEAMHHLSHVQEILQAADIPLERDYACGLPLIQVAQVRACFLAGHKLSWKPRNRGSKQAADSRTP